MTEPFVTIALCTHNHADRLVRTLADLGNIEFPLSSWELLLVDNASTDSTAALLADNSWRPPGVSVRIVREENLGLSNARNRAVREARGEYILFMDDDESPDPMWLTAHVGVMRTYRPDAVGGRINVLFEDGERPRWLQDEIFGFLGKIDLGEPRWLTERSTPIFGGNFAFRRKVFERIGQFDARLGRRGTVNIGGEDTEIYRRLLDHGCRVRWVPQAVIYHRIQTPKLRRSYFLGLHFRQGRVEGARARGLAARIPPPYLYLQVARAYFRALDARFRHGSNFSLRREMNASYFTGYLMGWIRDPT